MENSVLDNILDSDEDSFMYVIFKALFTEHIVKIEFPNN